MKQDRVIQALLQVVEQGQESTSEATRILATYALEHNRKDVARELLRIASAGQRGQKTTILRQSPVLYKLIPEETKALLIDAASDKDEWVRKIAAEAIGEIAVVANDEDLIRVAMRILEQEGENGESFYLLFGLIGVRSLPPSEGAIRIIRRALASNKTGVRTNALRIASLMGFCDKEVEEVALELVEQMVGDAIEASYRLGIHKKYPERFLRIDTRRISDRPCVHAYVRALCDLTSCDETEIQNAAWEKMIEVVRSAFWEMGALLTTIANEGKLIRDELWQVLWQLGRNPGRYTDWMPVLVRKIAHLMHEDSGVAERVLTALEQEGNPLALKIVEEYVAAGLEARNG